MTWHSIDIDGDIHTPAEARVLGHMVDAAGEPLHRYAHWTPAQALAHVRNVAAERVRALSHETGATA